MADAERIAHVPVLRHRRQVAPEDPPVAWRLGLAATPVPARVHRQAVTLRKHADDAVPAPAVKSGGVRQQKRRIFPRPLPHGEAFSTLTNEFQLRGSIHLCIFSRWDRPCASHGLSWLAKTRRVTDDK